MTDDLDFQESLDRYFEIEAAELLQTIEETLLQLVEEKTLERVHTLMRSAHTIKGGAANCGFKTIETIAHHLEDVFQALYPPELEIDPELGLLLMEGYDCLYDPLSALLAGVPYDEAATLERTAELFARLQTHLGDFFGRETPLPTAAELGFDVIGSIFTDSVPQDLEVLAAALTHKNVKGVKEALYSLAQFLLELGGSYSLPGIADIASTTLTALERYPDNVLAIAQVALTNFQQAQIAIVGGDRSVGGEVSSELMAWSQGQSDSLNDLPSPDTIAPTDSSEWSSFSEFTNLDATVSSFESESIDDSSSSEWLSLFDSNDSATNIETDEEGAIANNNSSDWLSLADSNDSATNIGADEEGAIANNNSSDWLSLADSNDSATNIETDEEGTIANNNSSDWLSLADSNDSATNIGVEEEGAIAHTDSADWLSLVDSNDSATNIAADEQEAIAHTDSADWLSLVDSNDSVTNIAADEQEAIANNDSSDWLSLVDSNDAANSTLKQSTEQINIDNAETRVAPDTEIIEVDIFELETGANSTQTEHLIAAIDQNPNFVKEFSTNSDLVLSKISGIDRIFQSISIEQPESASSTDEHYPTATSAPLDKSNERESQPAALVSVRVATVQLERLSHTIGELLIDDNQQFLRAEQLQKLAQSTVEQYRRCEQRLRRVSDWSDHNTGTGERLKAASRHLTSKGKKGHSATEIPSQFDSLELDVYSDLSILIQKLTDDIAELGGRVETLAEMAQKSRVTLGKRKQLLADAQAELFEARMVEISTVLNRFPRLLQQMIASHRKPAQLELIGTTVSIDKIIAEKLYDPLLHLIRNAYDHGVESPEIRRQQGKPDAGKLTIKAYHQGNRTTIEVSDDGQGLNWPKIRQRAIDMNLLPSHSAATATEAELAEIMFAPGFSTAEQVNDLSGRGIGLDVVRDRIGALQGSIDVRSIPGRGTTFVMQFPLNLTTARLLICESEGVVHALRSEAISQVLLPSPERLVSDTHRLQSPSSMEKGSSNFLRWGEGSNQKLIPIYPLNHLLDYYCPILPGERDAANLFPLKTKNSTNALLLLEIDDEQICIEVNRILVEQELVVKSLGQTFGLPNYVQGYSVLGDGSLTLALDPVELLSQVRTNTSAPRFSPKLAALQPAIQAALAPASDSHIPTETIAAAATTSNSANPSKQLQVLVVDDSLVQRQSLTRSLTKAGCQVVQASHGREAILRLQEYPRIRLVVCDIEMPQMNGFEFLSHCRQDPKLSQIPIVMLTTRSGQKHRQLAITLGAKDYLTKPQSERDLLDIVAKLASPVLVES